MKPKFKQGDKVRISQERYEQAINTPEIRRSSWDKNAIALYGKVLTVTDYHTLIGVNVTGHDYVIKGAWASHSLELCKNEITLPEELFTL